MKWILIGAMVLVVMAFLAVLVVALVMRSIE
jgi:hypothetical protein